jgi:hypothetical protein
MPSPNPEHAEWTQPTALLDLEDTRLRLKAQSLTQLCHSERESAVALYAYVKRLPFSKPLKLGLHTARQVLDRQRGDADDKATLLVALLRVSGFPARLHYVGLRGEVLRGLTSSITSIARPVVEVWVAGAWSATDTFIFDAAYIAGARTRLAAEDRAWGYGIGRDGQMLWAAGADAFLTGDPDGAHEVHMGSFGRYHDPADFVHSATCRQQFGGVTRLLQWNILAAGMEPTVMAVRSQGSGGVAEPA